MKSTFLVYFVLLGLVVSPPNSSAQKNNQLLIKNFSVKYNKPLGQGSAEQFVIPRYNIFAPIEIYLKKEGKSFILTYNNSEYRLKNPPLNILNVNQFKINRFNFAIKKTKTIINYTNFFSSSAEEKLTMKNLRLNCKFPTTSSKLGLIENVIKGCLQSATIGIASYLSINQKNSERTSLKEVSINILNGDVNFKTRISMKKISGKLTVKGVAYFEKNLSRIKFKLVKAKIGIFNVKRFLFKELARNTSGMIEVRKPYIYIKTATN